MIQFGASTEEVLERCERGQEGEDSMGLDLDWGFQTTDIGQQQNLG